MFVPKTQIHVHHIHRLTPNFHLARQEARQEDAPGEMAEEHIL